MAYSIESANALDGFQNSVNFDWNAQPWQTGGLEVNPAQIPGLYEGMSTSGGGALPVKRWRTDPYKMWYQVESSMGGKPVTYWLRGGNQLVPGQPGYQWGSNTGPQLRQLGQYNVNLANQPMQAFGSGSRANANEPYTAYLTDPFNTPGFSPYKLYEPEKNDGFWKIFDKIAPVLATAAVLGPAAYGAMGAGAAAPAAAAAPVSSASAAAAAAAAMPGTLPSAVIGALEAGMPLGTLIGTGAPIASSTLSGLANLYSGGAQTGGLSADALLGGGRDVLFDTVGEGYGVGMEPPGGLPGAEDVITGGSGTDVLAGQGADSSMEAAMGYNPTLLDRVRDMLNIPTGGGLPGGNSGDYVRAALGLGSAYLANSAANRSADQLSNYTREQQAAADPFGSQRDLYQDLLRQSYLDPLALYNSDQYKGLKDMYMEQIRRRDAAKGRNVANEFPRAIELQDHFMNWLDKYRSGLQNAAGTTIAPNNVAALGQLFQNQLGQRTNALGGYTNALSDLFDPYANQRNQLFDRLTAAMENLGRE